MSSHNAKRQFFTLSFLFLSLFTFSNCASPPIAPAPSIEEKVQRESSLKFGLVNKFEKYLTSKNDPQVLNYLNQLTFQLMNQFLELKGKADIRLIRDPIRGKWNNFGIPGVCVLLSLDFLQNLEFENELAAAIAIQLGHIINHHLFSKLDRKYNSQSITREKVDQSDFLGQHGIFNFSEAEKIQAFRSAADILYRAGYDPRGLVSILKKFKKNPSHSPYEMGTITKLMENTYAEIAAFAPLRNPIVRSESFLLIQKRIRQL